MPLEELSYDHTVHEDRRKNDNRLMVRFYNDIIFDPDATKDAGIRKFRDCTMVQIMVPGDRRNIIVREARDDDKERFAKQYERFQSSGDEALDGYPLVQWPLVARSQVEELKYLGFRTVENVAHANEAAFAKYPGLRELSRRAQAWLEAQQGAAPIEKMNSVIDAQNEEIAQLRAQMKAFMEGAGKNAQHAVASAMVTQQGLTTNQEDPVDLGEDKPAASAKKK